MLNRRLLRIKAMQVLFAAMQMQAALREAAADLITDTFARDLNSTEPYNENLQEGNRRMAILLLEENFLNDNLQLTDDTPADAVKAAASSLSYYRTQLRQERERFRQHLISETESLRERYITILRFLLQLAEAVDSEAAGMENNLLKVPVAPVYTLKLARNRVIEALKSNPALERAINQLPAPSPEFLSFTGSFYREVLKPDEKYEAYKAQSEAAAEDDYTILRHIVKGLIFKNEFSTAWFEEFDLYWTENREVVQSMVLKTLKDIHEGAEPFELLNLSTDWDDDRNFLDKLYRSTLAGSEEFETLIAARSENWDSGRIALTDKVIIMMALAEMLNFPAIPVKVTLNEYIELSRNYSTPQSRQFVNGMIDAIAKMPEMAARIKKSGRGLMDNKS